MGGRDKKGVFNALIDDEYIGFVRWIIGESGRFPPLAQLFWQTLPQKVGVLRDYLANHPEIQTPNPEATAGIFTDTRQGYQDRSKVFIPSIVLGASHQD
jgi:hypothetical protein